MEALESLLRSYGASDVDVGELMQSPERTQAALEVATRRRVNSVLRYTLALVRDESWRATTGAVRVKANVHAQRECARCGGDRVVLLREDYDPALAYDEVYVTCPECNRE